MTRSAYSHRITVTLTGVPNAGVALRSPFSFSAARHDDIIAIVQRAAAGTFLKAPGRGQSCDRSGPPESRT